MRASGEARGYRRYVPAVGPGLSRLLAVVLGLFSLLVVNSVYLVSVTIAGTRYQNWFYLLMFAVHLALGAAIVAPLVVFGVLHLRAAWGRPNRRAVRAGVALFASGAVLMASGIVLTRVDLFGARLELNHPAGRSIVYWVHVSTPLLVAWLFVLHRLAGRRIRWRAGFAWIAVAAIFAAAMLVVQGRDPRAWHRQGPASGERYFFPSLARSSTGDFIPARVLDNDEYCRECHADIHDSWLHSAHRLASFNNPAYLFSVLETRRVLMERDGSVRGSRFCAGCHDPVPFFSGAFEDPRFDDPDYDLRSDSMAQAGITCTACHAISHVNSVRGNADYTIDEPVHYPFAFSENRALAWVNRQLIKAKPAFHQATFLKPLHRSAEFCGACHKVHLPVELNGYKWLRGQNHYDSFWLSGVSGQGVASFYYPDRAEENCNGCHMPLRPVSDRPNFAARVRDETGLRKTPDHQFPSANTGVVHLLRDRLPDAPAAIATHREFSEGVARVDIFGLREGGRVDGALTAPLRPELPALAAGRDYLLEIVVRTLRVGHVLTQGTADSNQLWLDVEVRNRDRTIGRSGSVDPASGRVDSWAHFLNAFVLDRQGRRIDRRNAQDIFVALYDHQIPPGAADVVHYRLRVPADAAGELEVRVRLLYRKFDTAYMRLVAGDPSYVNDLPVMVLAEDRLVLPLEGRHVVGASVEDAPLWQRWNDYGIGLLRKGRLGELGRAAQAFARVEALGHPEGPLNLARVYLKEGRVQVDAPQALERAARFDPPAPAWQLLWFGAEVARRNGDHDRAIANLEEILRGGFEQAEGRGFEFSRDYRVLVALGDALYQRALREWGAQRDEMLQQARRRYEQALRLDPENLFAHWGLRQVFRDLGDAEAERRHTELHERYRPDDNARDRAVALARRRYPAADHAAEDVVIYDLRPGAR